MYSIYHITFASITDYLGYGLQIDTCLNNNIDVKILDISKIFNFPKPQHSKQFKKLVIEIDTYNELFDFISRLEIKNSIVNIQITYEWRFKEIFRMMSRLNQHKFSIFLLGQLPFHSQHSLVDKFFTTSISKLPKKIVTQIISRLLFKLNFLKLQNILFYAGETLSSLPAKKAKFPINFFDYDRYLESSSSKTECYAVFLDDGLFQHPDDKIVGNIITSELQSNYRKSLNHFFDFVEKTMKIKVIVSPHPKVNYTDNFFGSREVVLNRSRELVQNSKIVLCHCSSSISFAVCYNKPIYFLTDDNIISFSKKFQPFNEYIHNFATHLNRPVVNLSEPLMPWNEEANQIDQVAYNNFKLNYLTTIQTQNVLTKDIIIKDLLEVFNN
ncbi:MAG: hypothetical protein H7336_06045 [Bacteriovorax sp.]|nr:hypothetical protein [Bacteriovorax sp.]